ncbi:MAG TPA: acetyl-CoA carboxylase biotin carboxyl carrier protein [Bacteroidota bacterium]|nr:acetyl-CoA carboxylase biotin carboxyl carrier protein [Bacteroidota bacterium]
MDLTLVKKLVKLLSESDVDEIEIEEEGKKVRIAKHAQRGSGPGVGMPGPWAMDVPRPAGYPPPLPPSAAPLAPQPAAAPAPPAAVSPAHNLHEIRSPIVGTFYRAPAPDAAPFVQVGSDIQSGTVLCIVEAMKLMNEIEADIAGKIVKILVENGQPVEYDQVLFVVDKS